MLLNRQVNTMETSFHKFARLIEHPLKFRMFLFSRLPSAYFSGVRVLSIDRSRCVVTVPYKWFSQNPFRSTYFACLSMAAELSTGALAMAHTYQSKPAISMLVTHLEAIFLKKAVSTTSFACEDGVAISNAIAEAIATKEPCRLRTRSIGSNAAGEIISEFFVTWSFKVKE